MKLDSITRQYLETALWSSSDWSKDDDIDNAPALDKNHDITDIAESSIRKAIADCEKFENMALEADINLSQFNLETVGHDFWLTRNGHGAGFWDGDYPDEIGKQLTDICKTFGELNPYIGDDGKIYI